MGHFRCSGHIGKPRLNNLASFGFDLPEIEFCDLWSDCSYFGKRYPTCFFLFDGFVVHRDAAVKALKLDRLSGGVRSDTDKLSGRETADLARRNGKVELLTLAGGAVAGVDADGVLFLQYSPESLRDQSG